MKKSLEYQKSSRLYKKTSRVISNGVQTLSKQPDKFVEGVYPIYLEKGEGANVWDLFGNRYIDYPLGLGTILLGHAYKDVVIACMNQLERGSIFTLPSILETELAEKMVKLIPCAEKVRFLKTGSEATSAAIKIARAYTGRMGIAYCGYHGWHDWFTVDTIKKRGIPEDYGYFINKFEYNNIESLEKCFVLNPDIGAVILEPYIYDAPKDNFLKRVVELAHKNNALVIFDEVVTGFRTTGYSAQNMFGVKPDLCALGKAMGNGMPISVVAGKREIMDVLESDCFVSSTFGGELISIAASLATIKVLEKDTAIDKIWASGTILKNGYNALAKDAGMDTSCVGFPCRTMFMFPTSEHKALFWQECIKRGVLFGYAQFISYSHTPEIISETLNVIRDAFKVLKDNWDNPKKALEGKLPKEVFRLVVTKEQERK